MELIADILLAAGALGAGFYCYVLGRRLKKFNDLKDGVGGAVAILSAQVDDLTRTLETAQSTASRSSDMLDDLAERAERISRKLELQMASLHDVAQPPSQPDNPVSDVKNPAVSNVRTEPMFVRRHDTKGAA